MSTWVVAQTGLTGSTRDNFVKGAIGSCIRVNKAVAAKLSDFNLEKYCGCYANRVADQISPKDVEAMASTNSVAGIQAQVDSAKTVCGKAARAQTGLTGSTRDNFVKGAIGSCVRVNKADAAKLSDFNLEKYCGCYANRVADQISSDDVEAMASTHSVAGIQAQVDSAKAACEKAARGQ